MDCTFCEISRHTHQASIVYQDDLVMAFMDLYPINEGHVLVIPKAHYPTLADCPDEVVSHLALIVKRINTAVQSVTGAEAILNEVMNGASAGQEIFHTHFHIIPRNSNDGFGWKYPTGYHEAPALRVDLESTARKISSFMTRKK